LNGKRTIEKRGAEVPPARKKKKIGTGLLGDEIVG